MVRTAYVGLGGNLGDRLANLARAVHELEASEAVSVRAVSHAYESEPWGVTDQPAFANAVARIEFDGEADSLLRLLKEIEERMGRTPSEPNGPRVIDLDILLFSDEEWDSPHLTIPHPRLLERAFAVAPLLEVAPPGVAMPDGTPITAERAVEGPIVADLGEIAPPGHDDPTAFDGALEAGPEPTLQEREGRWVPVGPARYELGGPNSSSDFDLLYIEAELKSAGVPCGFDPHRPNEGHDTYPGIRPLVRLMVPEGRFEEARRIVDDLEAPVFEDEGADER